MKIAALLVFLTLGSSCIATAAEEKWIEVKSPHFSIITGGSTKLASKWLVGLEVMRADLNELAPFPDDAPAPSHIVIFGNGKVFNKLFVGDKDDAHWGILSTLIKTNNRAGRFSCAITDADSDVVQKSVFYQTALALTDHYGRSCPPWFYLGLQEIYGVGETTSKGYKIGFSDSGYLDQWLGDELKYPIAALLDPEFKDGATQVRREEVETMIWAFSYYLLLGDNGAHRPELARYLSAYQRGAGREVAEREAFPDGTANLQAAVSKFIGKKSYRTVVRPLPPDLLQGITMRPAADADVQLALGRVLLYSGGPEIASPYLQKALALAPENPEVHEALAELAGVRRDENEMIRRYEEAVAKGSCNYQAFLIPALGRAMPYLGGETSVSGFDPRQIRTCIESIKKAIRLKPGNLQAYQAVAGLMGSATDSAPDDLEILQAGDRLFPDRPALKAGIAACEIRAGRLDEAEAMLETLAANHDGSGVYQYAVKLQRRIKAIKMLARVEGLVAEGNFAEAEAIMPELRQYQFVNEERGRLVAINEQISIASLLTRLRRSLEEKNWDMVEILEQQLSDEAIPAALEAENKRLAAEIAARKPKAL